MYIRRIRVHLCFPNGHISHVNTLHARMLMCPSSPMLIHSKSRKPHPSGCALVRYGIGLYIAAIRDRCRFLSGVYSIGYFFDTVRRDGRARRFCETPSWLRGCMQSRRAVAWFKHLT